MNEVQFFLGKNGPETRVFRMLEILIWRPTTFHTLATNIYMYLQLVE